MNLLDVNVLVYAFRKDSDRHGDYRTWLLALLRSDSPFAVSEQVLSSVIRITTHPRVFKHPSTLKDAIRFSDSLLDQPNCRVVRPSENHWSIFIRLVEVAKAKANLVTDAWFAALAIESGCVWITTDNDFARFPSLRWKHPLDHSNIRENPS